MSGELVPMTNSRLFADSSDDDADFRDSAESSSMSGSQNAFDVLLRRNASVGGGSIRDVTNEPTPKRRRLTKHTDAETTAAKTKTTKNGVSLKSDTDKSLQTTLRLGQRNTRSEFAARRCDECGMMLVGGMTEDDPAHRRTHDRAIKGAKFAEACYADAVRVITPRAPKRKKNQASLRSFFALANAKRGVSDVSDDIFDFDRSLELAQTESGKLAKATRVAVFDFASLNERAETKPQTRRSVREAVSHALAVLGFDDTTGNLERGSLALLYVRKLRVMGVVISERVPCAYRVRVDRAAETNESDRTLLEVANGPVDTCRVGVKAMWTHKSMRRKGVMRKLLDTLRNECADLAVGDSFVEEALQKSQILRSDDGKCSLALEQLAFSQPTRMGRAFATSYCQRADFLAYD
ncbi:MAG: hypothetical protein MHM6MM_002254 [Cercozoa sp. M6MM]